MTTAQVVQEWGQGDRWVLGFAPLQNGSVLAASLSNGDINYYSLQGNKGLAGTINAHSQLINQMAKVMPWDGHLDDNLLASCSTDGVKVWDIRTSLKPVMELHNSKSIPFLSVTSCHGYLAAGTELKGADAEIHIWDLRSMNSTTPYRSLVDSQHDDVTCLQFHPTNAQMLLSGSTDGCVNIYNLNEQDENDALYQVISFSSIHSAGWLSANRIYTLSHMETFAIHELNDVSVEAIVEPQPLDFGDVRPLWGCDYVVDVYNGYIGVGSINGKNQVKLFKFENEKVDTDSSVVLNSPHGEEIARCLHVQDNLIFSGGEDGYIKVWESPMSWFDKPKAVENKVNKEKKENKEKKDKKSKSKHKLKTNSKVSKNRFKPY